MDGDDIIRDGHHRLLEQFREFGLTGTAGADPEAVRGAVAFLRQEIGPFAGPEEAALAGGRREAAAFEHAFLAAEVDALARVLDRRAADDERARLELARAAARIEAVLELHVARMEEEAQLEAASGPPAAEGQASAHGGRLSRTMSEEEIAGVIRRCAWGVLASAADGVPYAVPVIYAHDGRNFLVASNTGRKTASFEADPAVCFTIPEVYDDGRRWWSVVVQGRVEFVEELGGRLAAFELLRRQRRPKAPTRIRDAAKMMQARVLRIVPGEITGRTNT